MSQPVKRKTSVSQLLPGVSVSLQAQSFGSYEVVVFSPLGDEPSELYTRLRGIGFTPRSLGAQPVGVVCQSFARHGSGLLGGWTGPEREQYLGEARRTLRQFGFAFVPEVPHSEKSAGKSK